MKLFATKDDRRYLIGPSSSSEGRGTPFAIIDANGEDAFRYSEWLFKSFHWNYDAYKESFLNLAGTHSDMPTRIEPRKLYADLARRLANEELVVFLLPEDTPPEGQGGADADAGAAAESGRSKGASAGQGVATDERSEAVDGGEAPVAPTDQELQPQGDPVAPVTGEEILVLDDFTVPAPMPLTWQRRYRSGNCDHDLGFGAGWSVDCLRHIWVEEEGIRVLDHQGRVVCFNPLSPGEMGFQASAGMRLEYKRDSRMILTEKDGTAWRFSTIDHHLWHPVSVQNLRGQQWRFQYDREHRLSRIEVAPERYLQLVWQRSTLQSRERLVQVQLRQGDDRAILARYDYSETGDLVASNSHHGQERYQYRDHLLTRRELPTGYGINFTWQGQGETARCLRSWGDDGHHEFRFDYQPDKYQTIVTDAFGNRQVFHYDDQGRITARQEPDGATYQWQYDKASGVLVTYVEPEGRTTRYGYDALGRKLVEQGPDGREHRWHYNVMGFCSAERTPDGLTTRRQLDSIGRLLSEEGPDGSQWRYQYDANGWMTQATSDTGEVRRIGYSPSGDVLADERQGNLHRYAFDSQGRVAGTLQQDLVTEYDYEGAKLLAVHQYPEQAPDQRRSRHFGYNDAGLLTTYTNAVGDTHHYDYGKLARPEAYRRPDGHSVHYDYDLMERLTRVTRADGNQWQLGWNARGQVDRCRAPDGRDIHFHYNAAGEIIRREHPDVWVQTLERDEGGRVTTQTSQGRERAPVTRHYQYDRYGRRTHANCADRKVRWAWNNKGQVTEHHQDQHTVRYTYTSNGLLDTMTLPDGTEVRYRYDQHGQWTRLDLNGETAIRRTLDSQGRETERQAGDNKQSQIHDRYGCLIKRRWQGKTPATRRYRWDAESRLEAAIDSLTGDTYYERDAQGLLIKENDTAYQYDLGGNRIPEGGRIENDRLVETKEDRREYDTLGAEIKVIGKTTEHRKFDAEGQLTEVKKPGIHVAYGYDALGRRAWRKSEAGTTTYLWHNDVLMGEQDPEGQWQWYIRDPKTDEPLLTLIDGQSHFYELDWRMMPIRLWNNDGELAWQANADAWGCCQPEMPRGNIHQPIRLPGQFEDELTCIAQNRFREYSPDYGRYLNPDPLGLQGGLTSYRYTKNPLDYTDPLGLSSCETSGVPPKDATLGEDGPVGDDGSAFQNIELAGAAALARAPATSTPMRPTPVPSPATQGVTGAAANEVGKVAERSLLSRVTPILGRIGGGLSLMLHAPSTSREVDRLEASNGTIYTRQHSDLDFRAEDVDGNTWRTSDPQEDIQYRTWLANGGDGSIAAWRAEGKPSGIELDGLAVHSASELMSVPESDYVVREKTAAYLEEMEAKIQNGELSKKDVGPVVAGVLDRRTGQFYAAHNDRHGRPPESLHPLLKPKVERMQANPQHPSSPGSHAEIVALNEALNARGPDVSEEQLSEFTMLPMWAKGSGSGRMEKGGPAPRCGNCGVISEGVRNLSGDAPPLIE